MNEVIIRLRFNYFQRYAPYRSRKGKVLSVCLSHKDDLAIQEIDPKLTTVAYRVKSAAGPSSRRGECIEHYEIRSFDGLLWWPLVGREGQVSASAFLEMVAGGHQSANLTFDPKATLPFIDAPSENEYFERHRARELISSDRAQHWARVLRGATKVIFCGGVVLVEGGEPVWFGEASPLIDRLDFRIGCSSLDRVGSIKHGVPGLSRGPRLTCASDGLAFGLAELETEMVRLRRQFDSVSVYSEIETLSDRQSADTGVQLCERGLANVLFYNIRNYPTDHQLLISRSPTLAAARGKHASPDDLDFRKVLEELVGLGDDLTERYEEYISAARDIIRRRESIEPCILSEEDNDALGKLGP